MRVFSSSVLLAPFVFGLAALGCGGATNAPLEPGNPAGTPEQGSEGPSQVPPIKDTPPPGSREHDARFIDTPTRRANAAALTAILDAVFIRRTATDWAARLKAARLTFSLINRIEDVGQLDRLEEERICAGTGHLLADLSILDATE